MKDAQKVSLAGFLNARLDEDEAIARNALDLNAADWYLGQAEDADEHSILYEADSTLQPGRPAEYHLADRVEVRAAVHIGRHDPARVLRDVAALRAIVQRYERESGSGLPGRRIALDILTGPLRDLAAIWSGHPDYDPGWKP